MSVPQALFDPRRVRRHRERARATLAQADFLHVRIAEDFADRLEGVNRRFDRVLVLGGGRAVANAFHARPHLAVGTIFTADWAEGDVHCDPERLPFGDDRFDLVLSCLALHWVNDLPGALVQIRRALRPDGLFVGALAGGTTLQELRAALLEAEVEIRNGASPRVSPFAEIQDLAALLQRAGFALPVADRDTVTVRYASPLTLLQDLRRMGETAAFAAPGAPLTRGILLRAMEKYAARAGDDRRAPATFDILTVTGWKPHESQQKPLAPGSAKARLADALGVKEQSFTASPEPGDAQSRPEDKS